MIGPQVNDVPLSSLSAWASEVVGNLALKQGGGVSLVRSSLTWEHGVFERNGWLELTSSGRLEGCGMYLDASDAVCRTCRFIGNDATDGGAAFMYGGAALTLDQGVVTGNLSAEGYGTLTLYYNEANTLGATGTVVAWNTGYNVLRYSSGTTTLLYCDLYNPPGTRNHNLSSLDASTLTLEPEFLAYADRNGVGCSAGTSTDCRPADFHLALSSPLVDAGDGSRADADGTRADIGSYGGPGGAGWDQDQDGAPDYFWPGTFSDVPEGVDAGIHDCDDAREDVYLGALEPDDGLDHNCDGAVELEAAGWSGEPLSYVIENDGEAVAQYQALLVIDTEALAHAGLLEPDCADLRVTHHRADGDEALLSYWLEPGTCPSSETRLWVRVPEVPGGTPEVPSSTELRLYYGHPTAPPADSPPAQVFLRTIPDVWGRLELRGRGRYHHR